MNSPPYDIGYSQGYSAGYNDGFADGAAEGRRTELEAVVSWVIRALKTRQWHDPTEAALALDATADKAQVASLGGRT